MSLQSLISCVSSIASSFPHSFYVDPLYFQLTYKILLFLFSSCHLFHPSCSSMVTDPHISLSTHYQTPEWIDVISRHFLWSDNKNFFGSAKFFHILLIILISFHFACASRMTLASRMILQSNFIGIPLFTKQIIKVPLCLAGIVEGVLTR